MEGQKNYLRAVCSLFLLGLLIVTVSYLSGCQTFELIEQQNGKIALSIAQMADNYCVDGVFLKSNSSDLDTNNFILSIYSSAGDKIYEGSYGSRPQEIVVTPGAYDVSLYSAKHTAPKFDFPIFGDVQTIVVEQNQQASVCFNCRQMNAGLRLHFATDFLIKFPGSGVGIIQNEKRLQYDYNQTKYAYVWPENFDVVFPINGVDSTLLCKKLEAGQMVNMKLTYSSNSSSASAFKIVMDTTRDWINCNYNVGLRIPTGAYSIEQAKEHIGEKGIAVFGYIYGGDATNNSIRIYPPFESKSSLVIAPSMSERNRNNCFVVELPSGKIRDALNLVDKAFLLGSAVVITGEIVSSYYGYPGIKGAKSYKLL